MEYLTAKTFSFSARTSWFVFIDRLSICADVEKDVNLMFRIAVIFCGTRVCK